jgi:hypothetical protein
MEGSMGLVIRREEEEVVVATAPRRTFRAWLVLHLGPPPQPPRRYFSKSMAQGGGYRGVPGPRRPL